jgi:hypothetical protein
MKNKISRNKFLKLAALGSIGLYVNACRTKKTKKKAAATTEKIPADTISIDISSSQNLIIHKKGETIYETLRGGFNKRIQKYPKLIVQCKNTQGIAEAINYAIANKLAVAVKSGGHCFEGFSSNNDGLVINLSLMNTVEWLDNSTIKIQPGCTLSKLYDTILPKRRIIPAGSCGGVGVGGLTLGGGYGFFSRKYGLTCDSLIELTMVDSKGIIRNTKDHPELLWACKGGGNGNFGIVTEMIFKTYDAPAHFTSHRFKALNVDVDRVQTIMEKWFQLTTALPVSCFSAFVHNGRTLNILLTDYENNASTVQQFKETLTAFVDKVTIGTPKPLAASLKNYYGIQYPIYFKNASAGLYENYANIQPFIKEVLQKVIDTPGMIYQINTLGGNINQLSFKDTSAYPHRAYPYLSELQTYWDAESQTKKYETAFEEVQSIFRNNHIQTQYRNYPDINFKDWQHAYYGENYNRLQQIKQQFDPDNVFGYEQGIERKIKIS